MGTFIDTVTRTGGTVLDLLRRFSFKDAIDVAIVTLLLYALIKLVRDTRAGQLVKGIILLVALYLLSFYGDLLMLNSILRAFLQSTVIMVVILFQPEIRKALEQVGHSKAVQSITSNLGGKSRDGAETRAAIEGVVEATAILQQLRMGALIVFERQTKLGEIISTGTLVDAGPSGQLIANIFFNKAPLHDGGHDNPGRPGVRGRVHTAPYRQRQRFGGAWHPAPGRHRHERKLGRGGGGGL